MNLMMVCSEGHDLTLPGAYIQTSSGNRTCRECMVATKRKRPTASTKQTKGGFDG